MRRAAIVGLSIGAAALATAGIAVAVWAGGRPPAPSDVAMTYLSALASGDTGAALAATDLDEDESRSVEAASAGVAETITDPRVLSASDSSDTSRVTVSYSLGASEVTRELELVDDANGWRIVNGVAAITPRTSIGDSVGFGAVMAAADAPIVLLPGRYDVEALPSGIVTGSATIDVAPGIDAEVSVSASVSPGAAQAAQTQLDTYVDACTAPAATVPANCGLRIPWAADLASAASFAFTVEQQPVVELSDDGRSFAATGGVVIATVSGTGRDGQPASFTYRADDWALRGTVTFQGNDMVLAVG